MIRRAVPSDLPDILEIYAIARRFMAQAGNPDQWRDVYPPEDLVQDDIRQGFCHVCVLDGRIQGVFAAMCWDDPDYQVIQGAWLNDRPYWAVHRVASRGEVRGVASGASSGAWSGAAAYASTPTRPTAPCSGC